MHLCMPMTDPREGYINIWVFPKIVVPQYEWFIMENPIEMDDLGEPSFKETPIYYVYLPTNSLLKSTKWG